MLTIYFIMQCVLVFSSEESNGTNTLIMVIKVFWMLCTAVYEIVLSVYRLLVPGPEKSVKGEIVLVRLSINLYIPFTFFTLSYQ